MNATLACSLVLLAAAASVSAPQVRADACAPQLTSSATRFPISLQLKRQVGTVHIDAMIDETGRVQEAVVRQSSGYRGLDRAATQSVVSGWVFDVSTCQRDDLPVNRRVAVEYKAMPY